MAFKILKDGKPPTPEVYEGRCAVCACHFRCHAADTEWVQDSRMARVAPCPCCRANVGVRHLENPDE